MRIEGRETSRRRKFLFISLVVALSMLLPATHNGLAQGSSTIILYQNNFETPTSPPGNFCASDFSQTPVNTIYGPGFQQVFTPEIQVIDGPSQRYSDPSGTGGKYTLGMLESLQDDKLALTFDTQGRTFINIGIDISAISGDSCGVNQAPGVPVFRLSLYDSPGGAFNISAPGTLLDTVDIAGTATPQQFVFDWTHHVTALDASGSTDGKVSLMWDVVGGFYAAFDNLGITASDTSGVVDNDFDGITDDLDSDDDNDNLPDTTEDANGNKVVDSGETNPLDPDSDDDSVNDGDDSAPLDPGVTTPRTELPGGKYGTAYTHTFTATGPTPITWSLVSGALPPGLTLNSTTGALSGRPTTLGSFRFSVRASNSGGTQTQAVTLVIGKASLVVRANSRTMVRGAALPALTYTVSGLVNGDTAATALTGALATTATAGSPVGSYPITQGTLAAANYTISFTGAQLTVTSATSSGPLKMYLPMFSKAAR